MPDINLLPPEDRKKEQQENAFVKSIPKINEVVLTNPKVTPPRPPPPPLPRKPSPISDLPLMPKPSSAASSVDLRPSMVATSSEKAPTSRVVGETRQSWWRRLFGATKHPQHQSQPPIPVPPRQTAVARILPESPSLLPPSEKPPPPAPPPPAKVSSQPPPVIPQPRISSPPPPAKGPKPPTKSGVVGGISLLPEEYQKVDEQAVLNLFLTLTASIVISMSVIGFSYLLLDQTLRLTAQHELENLTLIAQDREQEIAQKEDQRLKARLLQQKIAVAGQLLDRHRYWTQPLALVGALTDHDVLWQSVEMENPTTIALSGGATSLRAVARQLVMFRNNEKVKTVAITGATAGEEGKGEKDAARQRYPFSFSAKVTIDPAVVLRERSEALGGPRP